MTSSARDAVVVGVDGTSDGERAIDYAVALASREGLDVRLVHVPPALSLPGAAYLPATTVREIGDAALQEAAKHAEERGLSASRLTTLLATGSPTSGLLASADGARCIVLGTRASALQHLLTGATSMSVAAHSPVPVHCVPRRWAEQRDPWGTLVAGVDGSGADHHVLEEAFAESATRRAGLRIVHAWRPLSPYDAAVMGRVLLDEWEKTTRDALNRCIEEVARAHPDVEWTLDLRFERVPVALHEATAEADLLVLGRHGHHPVLSLLVGSNTRTLLRTATCPVVVVPVPSAPE